MINRDFWQESYIKEDFPHWNCPECKKSFLTFLPDGIREYETAKSIENRKEEPWDITERKETFIGLLQCNNKRCNQFFSVVGNVITEPIEFGEIESSFIDEKSTYREYYPKNFNPTLHIFEIPVETPMDVEFEIITAFKLFWLDKPSCANQIRKVVEAIMDDKRIRKTFKSSKGKTIKYTLHERIERFKTKKVAETLLAIKWIGNSGSHLGDLDNEELLDGIELLEDAINQLYNTDKNRIQEIKKQVLKKYDKKARP